MEVVNALNGLDVLLTGVLKLQFVGQRSELLAELRENELGNSPRLLLEIAHVI